MFALSPRHLLHRIRDRFRMMVGLRSEWRDRLSFLRKAQGLYFWGLLVLLLAAAGYFLFQGAGVVKSNLAVARTPAPDGIPLQLQDKPLVEERDDALVHSTVIAQPGFAAEQPFFDWSSEAPLRKAASVLIQNGRIDDGIALLRRSDSGTELAANMGAAVITALKRQRDLQLEREVRNAQAYWKTLTPPQQASCFVRGQDAKVPEMQGLLATQPEHVTLAQCRDGMPDSMMYVLLSNLRNGLKDGTPGRELLVGLLLEDAIRAESLVGRLYYEAYHQEPLHFGRHISSYNEAVADGLYKPVIVDFFHSLKRSYLSSDVKGKAWMREVYGTTVIGRLAGMNTKALKLKDAEPVWKMLPDHHRWAASRDLFRKSSVPLSPACLLSNAWIKDAVGQQDVTLFVTDLKRFPSWHARLNAMDYTGAYSLIERQAEIFRMSESLTSITQHMRTGLVVERKGFLNPSFEWVKFARALQVNTASLPEAVRQKFNLPILSGRKYSEVSSEDMRKALSKLGRTQDIEKQNNYSVLLQIYAQNRGLH